MSKKNQQTYTAPDIVSYYSQLRELQAAEKTILERFRSDWKQLKVLDMGIGGGRTTQYLASLVSEYVGIDYSPEMIRACQARFTTSEKLKLLVCDARDLSRLEESYFDFILFSFNGLDYISHEERLQVLKEVKRVGKSGSYFYFSTHNLQGLEDEFNGQKKISLNPFTSYVNLVMLGFLHLFNYPLNLKKIQGLDYLMVRDEPHNFRLSTYYIRPIKQLEQLQPYFTNIQVYSWLTGLEVSQGQELKKNREMWLYYLCQIP
jgi:ubiquinone/menaquinone biosynthesis C-methylase UbiE